VSDRPIIRVQHVVKSLGTVMAVLGVLFVALGAWRFSKIEA